MAMEVWTALVIVLLCGNKCDSLVCLNKYYCFVDLRIIPQNETRSKYKMPRGQKSVREKEGKQCSIIKMDQHLFGVQNRSSEC